MWEIIVGVAAIASIAMWIWEIFKEKRRFREWIYPAIAIILAFLTAIFAVKNREMMDPVVQAKELAQSWPPSTLNWQFHGAQAEGIVLAGLRYLETFRNRYPETYKRHSEIYAETDFSNSLEATRAADTMIAAIRSYAGLKVDLP